MGKKTVGMALKNCSGLRFSRYERHERVSEIKEGAFITRVN